MVKLKTRLRDSLLYKYWVILTPFHKIFGGTIGILLGYELLQLFDSYSFSLLVKFTQNLNENGIQFMGWNFSGLVFWVMFFLVLSAFDEIYMRMDNMVDWQIVARQSYNLYRFLKLEAIKKFLAMDIMWHQKRNSGSLVGKVANGVEKVDQLVGMLSWEFLPTGMQAIISVIPLLFFSPFAALVISLTFIFFAKFSLAGQKEKRPLKKERFDRYEDEWHSSIEIVQSVETSYMFGQTERRINEQKDLHDQIINLGIKEAYRGIYHYARWQIRITRWARRLIWALWVYQLYTGSMDIASLVFANVLSERLFSSFWRFSRLLDRAYEATEGAKRLEKLLNDQPTFQSTGKITTPINTPVGIKLEHVKFAYTKDYTDHNGGLHNLSLEIPAGKIVAVVGPSGAGKTTIRKVITGLIPIQSGKIMVGGVDTRNWDSKSLLAQFSYVPQGDDVFLFNESIKDNIAFARPDVSMGEVINAAQLSGIHEFIAALTEGYETRIGERGKRLSGGQKQRVALARAIIANRPILILDEATSSVDAITEEEIHNRMREILADKTAIVIAHRLSTIWGISDKIIVLDKGRKVEEGTHDELVAKGGLYANMAALQTKEAAN